MRWRNVGANPLDALPDFQNFQYTIGVQLLGSQISAWVKLREAERRLTMYKWAEQHNAIACTRRRSASLRGAGDASR